MLFEVKINDARIIELISMFEKSCVICPWWVEDSLEEKSAKLLGWLQSDPCLTPNAEKSKRS